MAILRRPPIEEHAHCCKATCVSKAPRESKALNPQLEAHKTLSRRPSLNAQNPRAEIGARLRLRLDMEGQSKPSTFGDPDVYSDNLSSAPPKTQSPHELLLQNPKKPKDLQLQSNVIRSCPPFFLGRRRRLPRWTRRICTSPTGASRPCGRPQRPKGKGPSPVFCSFFFKPCSALLGFSFLLVEGVSSGWVFEVDSSPGPSGFSLRRCKIISLGSHCVMSVSRFDQGGVDHLGPQSRQSVTTAP